MVAYCYFRTKPTGNHLSPRGPRLIVLICHCRVATEVDGGYVGLLNMNRLDGGQCSVEFQCQSVVPSQIVFLTIIDLYTIILVDLW